MRYTSTEGLRVLTIDEDAIAIYSATNRDDPVLTVRIEDGIASFAGDAPVAINHGRKPKVGVVPKVGHAPADVMDEPFVVSIGKENVRIEHAPYAGSETVRMIEMLVRAYGWGNIIVAGIGAGILVSLMGLASLYYSSKLDDPMRGHVERIVTQFETERAGK